MRWREMPPTCVSSHGLTPNAKQRCVLWRKVDGGVRFVMTVTDKEVSPVGTLGDESK